MLRVRLLGDLALEVDGTPIEPPTSRRARALLGWLALDRRMHPRSALAARVWPDVLDESARTSLRSALSALRRALGPDCGRYLIASRDEIGLANGSLVWIDVAEFERCIEENRLQDALAISRGELLCGLEDEWVCDRRDEHRDRVAGVLARLAAGAERDGDLRTAIEYTRRQVALDPLAEEPQRDLMRRLAAAGDRPAAIRAYDRLSRRLRDELRLAPAHATRELAETLRRGGETADAAAGAAEQAAERTIALALPFIVEDGGRLVGRDAQLERMRCQWQDARAGHRQVVVLVGEPGIGKTRLAAEFCRGAYQDGALVLLGRCYEDSLVPYQSVVEALRQYVSQNPPEALRLTVARHQATLARLLPELADSAVPTVPSSTTEPPDREQFMLFDAVASVLRSAAEDRPLILVLDDLHWGDAPTLLLLRHVVRATERAPLLILGTYRDTEVDEAHPLAQALAELRHARVLEALRLEGLGEEEVAAMVSSQSGRTAPVAVVRAIVDRTHGNPFFVEELLREVAAEADFAAALTRIPDSVKDLLVRRLRRLDDGCRRLLTIAAVAGREFALDVIQTVAGATAEEVAASLEQAVAAQVIQEPSIGHYSFGHALIQETIYDRLSLTRRAQLHRRIGEALESALADQPDEQTGPLAYHFSAAGNVAKAYEYHSRAGAAAQVVCAIEPALAHFTEALAAASRLNLVASREPAVRVLLLGRGRLRWRSGDLAGAGEDLEAALDAARRAGDRAAEMETLTNSA